MSCRSSPQVWKEWILNAHKASQCWKQKKKSKKKKGQTEKQDSGGPHVLESSCCWKPGHTKDLCWTHRKQREEKNKSDIVLMPYASRSPSSWHWIGNTGATLQIAHWVIHCKHRLNINFNSYDDQGRETIMNSEKRIWRLPFQLKTHRIGFFFSRIGILGMLTKGDSS